MLLGRRRLLACAPVGLICFPTVASGMKMNNTLHNLDVVGPKVACLDAEQVEVAGAGALAGPDGVGSPDGLQADEAHDRAALGRQQMLPDPAQAFVARGIIHPSAYSYACVQSPITHTSG